MENVWDKVKSYYEPLPRDKWPIWSMDNANVHVSAVTDQEWGLGRVPSATDNLMEFWPAAWSPDMHKVIEHTHANLMKRVRPKLAKMTVVQNDIQAYWQLLQTEFYNLSHQAIVDDVESMPDTYKVIIDLKGHYPPRSHR